jgi:hypothetical protein
VFSLIFSNVLFRVSVSSIFCTNSFCYLQNHNISFVLLVFSILLILDSLYIFLGELFNRNLKEENV